MDIISKAANKNIKNDYHHKSEAQNIQCNDKTNIEKYGVAVSTKYYHIISYYIKINLPNNHHFRMIRQLFHVKNVFKNVNNKHV